MLQINNLQTNLHTYKIHISPLQICKRKMMNYCQIFTSLKMSNFHWKIQKFKNPFFIILISFSINFKQKKKSKEMRSTWKRTNLLQRKSYRVVEIENFLSFFASLWIHLFWQGISGWLVRLGVGNWKSFIFSLFILNRRSAHVFVSGIDAQ